jgi:hypothetical protein
MNEDSDSIAMVECMRTDKVFHDEMYNEDAHRIAPNLDRHLNNFRVLINLGEMRDRLKEQNSISKDEFHRIHGTAIDPNYVSSSFINRVYAVNVSLMGDPQDFKNQELFIYSPRIKVREGLVLECLEGVEAILTSGNQKLVVPYQEVDRSTRNGFLLSGSKLLSKEYSFSFNPTDQLKNVDISFRR